jgi:hypothetical protein
MAPTRQRMYDEKGAHYERQTYGAAHMRTYGQFRNDALVRVARDAFPETRPLTILESWRSGAAPVSAWNTLQAFRADTPSTASISPARC